MKILGINAANNACTVYLSWVKIEFNFLCLLALIHKIIIRARRHLGKLRINLG